MKQNYFSLLFFTIALMVGGGLLAQSPCDPDGDGNPEHNPNTGEGEGTDNAAGYIAWELLLNTDCSDQDQDERAKDYDPTDQCNNSSSLIPETGFNSLRIAIIDSGIRPTSPGFFNGNKLISHTVRPDGTLTENVAYPHPHGTYSAGVISGMLARHGIAGLGFVEYEFYDYQVLNGELRTSLAAVEAAIIHATEKGVNLIALSIGFVPRDCDGVDWDSPDSPLNYAIEKARQAGIIIITSAGNDGNDLAEAPQYPAASTQFENVISVGALSCGGGGPTSFSNYGDGIIDVFTTGAFVQVFYNGCFHSISGTSFATSIVAGKAALHLTKNQEMDEVLCLLRSQTKPFANEQHSIYGIVDVPEIPEDGICANGETYDPDGGSAPDYDDNPGAGDVPGGGTTIGGVVGGTLTGTPGVRRGMAVLTSPNPFADQLLVEFDAPEGPTTVSLLDGHGRRVLSRQVTQPSVQLDLDYLPPGVYWLNVRNAENNETRKVIKK